MSDVLVIGGGVVGVSSALFLLEEGHNVTLVERKGIASEASGGNAGAFALTDVEPLASPGIMRQAPRWLLDPTGPLALDPFYAPFMAEWLLRFWGASRPGKVKASTKAIGDLMRVSAEAFDQVTALTEAEPLIRRDGQLQLYEGEAAFRAAAPVWQARADHGVRFEMLESPGAIAEIQPGLSPRFTHAGYTPDWCTVTDPKTWVWHLFQAFRDRGGVYEEGRVSSLTRANGRVRASGDRERWADRVVVAAGPWSHRLARTLGDRIPLETERGYNTTIADPGIELRTFLTFTQHGFVMSKIGNGVRVGGAVELAGLDKPPNPKRWKALLDKGQAFLPGLRTEGGQQWMGFRPSLPDSLPVIGPSPRAPEVIYAFGHGHYGLTQSAGTARLVADLVAGRAPAIDLAPFRAERFRILP
ncbi:FAD-dependent oxidoreductase [Alphaproteobacteria bacterium GH1-50]|uniref:FAD-dependent oxidoreductase n=1 Tax=Kangsaoukella pontilimi TaxID=2691042 RepID=A0A7C9MQK7_9RHOB|nr:FAD-dependent oxidoreductase [Kangsaoukella pontilimi]MXQ07497.1 FAD-dependent oxidoreductase [Kangsaoukella pontilimi]